MEAPFLQGGYANSTMPHFNLIANPFAMAAPYVQGGYTSLLWELIKMLQSNLLLGGYILIECKTNNLCNFVLLLGTSQTLLFCCSE
jgi:hypothetical protein